MNMLHIVLRDLKIVFSDKKALGIILLMPIILTSILGFALKSSFGGDSGTSVESFHIAIVEQYEKDMLKEEIDLLLESDYYLSQMKDIVDYNQLMEIIDFEDILYNQYLGAPGIADLMSFELTSLEQGEKMMAENKISAILILKKDYLAKMYVNVGSAFVSPVEIELMKNPDRSLTPDIAKSLIDGFTETMSGMVINKNAMISTVVAIGIKDGLAELTQKMMPLLSEQNASHIRFVDEEVPGLNFVSSSEYYAVAMLAMFILFAASFGSKMILKEKREYTFQRSMITGTSPWKLLLAKSVTVFCIAFVQMIVMVLYTSLVLGVSWGDPIKVGLVALFSGIAVAGLGVFIGAIAYLSDSYKMATLMESGVFQVMAFFGGSFMPLMIMPKWFQTIGYATVNGAALKAYLSIMLGQGYQELLLPLFMLLGNALLFSALGIYMFNKKGGWLND